MSCYTPIFKKGPRMYQAIFTDYITIEVIEVDATKTKMNRLKHSRTPDGAVNLLKMACELSIVELQEKVSIIDWKLKELKDKLD